MIEPGRPARLVLLAVLLLPIQHGAARSQQAAAQPEVRAEQIPFADARPILEQLPALVPQDLLTIPPGARETAWPRWVARRDGEIRARLALGEEDSVVNFLLFGTSFTRAPRALNDRSRIGGSGRDGEIVRRRTSDLVAAAAAAGADERLAFVRDVLARRGIDLSRPEGRERAQQHLADSMTRVAGESRRYVEAIESGKAAGRGELAVRSSLFRDRGLSSDTSIAPDYAIDRALGALAAGGSLTRPVRRVAVVGPGLDFTDKSEGYDFYPQQTTQPFAVIEALLRRGLATLTDLHVTTLDLSPRVNGHLQSAMERARQGGGYRIVLHRDPAAAWSPELVRFWTAFGTAVGAPVSAPATPDGVTLDVRAVSIRPEVVALLDPRDLNVVLQRLVPSSDGRFDLIVATNVLVYYDLFEQSLALANIASMLAPGGLLLSNNVLVELPSVPVRSIGHTTVRYSQRADDNDDVIWYRRD